MGFNGVIIRFYCKEMNSLKFKVCIKYVCIKGIVIYVLMIVFFIVDMDIYLYYIYSVRKRDLLISVID